MDYKITNFYFAQITKIGTKNKNIQAAKTETHLHLTKTKNIGFY